MKEIFKKFLTRQGFLLLFVLMTMFGAVDFVSADIVKETYKSTEICDPLTGHCSGDGLNGKEPNVNRIIGKIIQIVLGIVGSLALGMFVYGGLILMLSAGNSERVQKGKDVLIWATVGLVVVFTAYAAVSFVIKGLTETG